MRRNYIALKNIFNNFSRGFNTLEGQRISDVQFKKEVVVNKVFFGLFSVKRDVLIKSNGVILSEFEYPLTPMRVDINGQSFLKFDTNSVKFKDPELMSKYYAGDRIVMFLNTDTSTLEIYNKISNWENNLYLGEKDYETVLNIIRNGRSLKELDDYYVDLSICKLIHRSEIV